MSKISKEGFQQIQVIKNALDSMFRKLDRTYYIKDDSNKVKDIEKLYVQHSAFNDVKDEFEAIAGIVENTGTWVEVE